MTSLRMGQDVVGLKSPQNLKKESENLFQRSIPGNKTQHKPYKTNAEEGDRRAQEVDEICQSKRPLKSTEMNGPHLGRVRRGGDHT